MIVHRHDVAELVLGPASGDTWEERNVVFTDPAGRARTVPAFVCESEWRVRYSSGLVGAHTWRGGDRSGSLTIAPGPGDATLSHGPLVVSAVGDRFEHADGTPFLWLADTWWHAFVSAKCTDDEFAELARRRAAEGFSVIQVAAGLLPEVAPFSPAGASQSGWPWEPGYVSLNLDWWDAADRRVRMLVENDLVPCIAGQWGYYLSFMTRAQLMRHWREMIARWGAYPVVWCLAGEPQLLWYDDLADLVARRGKSDQGRSVSEWGLDSRTEQSAATQKQIAALNLLARDVRAIDPFDRLTTTHTTTGPLPWEFVEDHSLIDFWFLQTGHYGHATLGPAIAAVRAALERVPRKPVVNGEVCYEGIAGSSGADVQRFLFWSHMLLGCGGVSYGAHGLWAFNTPEFPGQYSGRAPDWRVASRLPGGRELGIARGILLEFPWHELVPADGDAHITNHGAPEWFRPYAARLPDGRRLVYFPSLAFNGGPGRVELRGLDHPSWEATPIELTTGERFPATAIAPDAHGVAELPGLFWPFPDWGDWLLEVRPA